MFGVRKYQRSSKWVLRAGTTRNMCLKEALMSFAHQDCHLLNKPKSCRFIFRTIFSIETCKLLHIYTIKISFFDNNSKNKMTQNIVFRLNANLKCHEIFFFFFFEKYPAKLKCCGKPKEQKFLASKSSKSNS